MRTTQRTTTTITLLAVLATGLTLLLFPTVCTCGADAPHPHALFELSRHHHGPLRAPISSDAQNVNLLAPSGGTALVLGIAILPALANPPRRRGRTPCAGYLPSSPSGRQHEPDSPPPRKLDDRLPRQFGDHSEEALCGFFALSSHSYF